MLLLLLVAFIAGLATAVSPCVLPILPIVLATGADGDRRRPYLVIAGLIASFSFFTLASVQLIRALHLPSSSLRDAAIVVIALFGLTLLVPALSVRFERLTARLPGLGTRLAGAGPAGMSPTAVSGSIAGAEAAPGRGSIVAGLATGVGLGLVWTPCAGPILGAITSLAVTAPGSLATLALVVAYAIGAGLPLLAIALGGRAAIARLRLRNASAWASRAFGTLVLVTAGLMAVGADTTISANLTSALPDWTGALQTIERSGEVQSALHDVVAGANAGPDTAARSTVEPGSSISRGPRSGLRVGPAAPEFAGIDHWLNSDPLTMAGLRGKVVLVDFWTYSCINCIRTLPYVEGWYEKYRDQGFVVVGVHSPEFAFEHDTGNVTAAIARFGITYPVAQDNEFSTWAAYNNAYWPAHYLIDADGYVRATRFGEGDYIRSEEEIRSLLAEAGASALPSTAPSAAAPPFVSSQTRETYIGTDRASAFASPEGAAPGPREYTFPGSLPNDRFAVSGTFDFQPQFATATAAGDKIELNFYARDVYLVMAADSPVAATVAVTGAQGAGPTDDVAADGSMTIETARLYHLVHLPAPARGTVIVTFNAAGARSYAFTFGG
jgi:cytochrome c biogenesis protein CcdA/thiol-disulfide isomerase/thioredoxin